MKNGNYFLLSENNNCFWLTVSPFSEKDFSFLINSDSIISVEEAYIQYFGKDINSDGYYTEKDFIKDINYIGFNHFLNSLIEYSINSLHLKIEKLDIEFKLKDEIVTTLIINDLIRIEDYLLKILNILQIDNKDICIELIINNLNKYICIDKTGFNHEIFNDFWEMQSYSKIIE